VSRYLRILGAVLLGLAVWNGIDVVRPSNPLAVLDGIKAGLCLAAAVVLFWIAAKQRQRRV